MTVETAFRELYATLQRLQDALRALHLTVLEDAPAPSDARPVEAMAEAILGVEGHVVDALTAAADALSAVSHPRDLALARHRLTACSDGIATLGKQVENEVAHERLSDLVSLARERGGEWMEWLEIARLGLRHVSAGVHEVGGALVVCWQELADRTGVSVALQNTNVGPNISVARDVARERIT